MVERLKPSFLAGTVLIGRHVPQYSSLLMGFSNRKSQLINLSGYQYMVASFQRIQRIKQSVDCRSDKQFSPKHLYPRA